MQTYFTSDWHLNETRIKEFNPFFRPFETIDEQNQTILANINRFVKKDDLLYHLGDVSVDIAGIDLLEHLHCKNKVLIIGNYDVDKLDKLQKHFTTMREDLELRIGEIPCYLNHYPAKQKPNHFNIVGHIHSLWKIKPNMVNVGVDAWHFRPVSEQELTFIHTAMKNNRYDKNVF